MTDPRHADIYLDARGYDAMFDVDAGGPDLAFWLDLAHRHGDPVLELTCGSGRVAVPLAEAGFRVTGLDTAETMLSEARRRARERGVDVRWVQGDMRSFELDTAYSLIIVPANAFLHLLTRRDIEACLQSVRRHLPPDGRFALDVFVPKPELLVAAPGKRFPFGEYDDPEGQGHVVVTHSYVYEADTQIKRITTYHTRHTAAGPVETQGQLVIRMLYPQELDTLLTCNGFTITDKFGDYAYTPFGATSEKQLVICRTT